MKDKLVNIHDSWHKELKEEFEKEYFLELMHFLKEERNNDRVFPQESKMYSAFDFTPFNEVKVVILGQDPYHGPGQAHGLCFSVPEGIKVPPSLVNIYKELHSDIGMQIPRHGNLEEWAKQGVFLLNATLTVRAHTAGSHQKKGWEQFTDKVVSTISNNSENVVFLLWGRYAQAKSSLIDETKHLILNSVHPSPLSAYNGFYGCKHFSKTNEFLEAKSIETIDWNSVNNLDLSNIGVLNL